MTRVINLGIGGKETVQLTYEAAWYPSPSQTIVILELMRRFQCVKRLAFNYLLKKQKRQSIVTQIRKQGVFTNARYIRSAIEEAKALITSQKELVPLYCQETHWKLTQIQCQLTSFRSQLTSSTTKPTPRQHNKLQGLTRKYQKLQTKYQYWLTHRKNKTIPPIIFGGKKLFHTSQKDPLAKIEWNHHRTNGIYCVGEQNRQGNANLRLFYDINTNHFSFSMLVDRGTRNERLSAPLYVPPTFQKYFKRSAQGQLAYSVRVLKSPKKAHFRVLVSIKHVNSTCSNNNGIAGLDLNPIGIAVTLLHSDGNYRKSKWFSCPKLLSARTHKRHLALGTMIKEIFTWIQAHQINTISLEALKFTKQYGACRTFNRVKSNFMYQKMHTTIYSQAHRARVKIRAINPAYTSVIGELKYRQRYGLNAHQAAAVVIGRRGLGLNDKLYDHINGKRVVMVVPPMEGWTSTQITRFARDIDEFTARLGNSTGKVSVGSPRLITRR